MKICKTVKEMADGQRAERSDKDGKKKSKNNNNKYHT